MDHWSFLYAHPENPYMKKKQLPEMGEFDSVCIWIGFHIPKNEMEMEENRLAATRAVIHRAPPDTRYISYSGIRGNRVFIKYSKKQIGNVSESKPLPIEDFQII